MTLDAIYWRTSRTNRAALYISVTYSDITKLGDVMSISGYMYRRRFLGVSIKRNIYLRYINQLIENSWWSYSLSLYSDIQFNPKKLTLCKYHTCSRFLNVTERGSTPLPDTYMQISNKPKWAENKIEARRGGLFVL